MKSYGIVILFIHLSQMAECKFYNPDFIILSSLASFYIPCVILLVLNYKIIKAFLGRSKSSQRKKRTQRKKKRRKVRTVHAVQGNLFHPGSHCSHAIFDAASVFHPNPGKILHRRSREGGRRRRHRRRGDAQQTRAD